MLKMSLFVTTPKRNAVTCVWWGVVCGVMHLHSIRNHDPPTRKQGLGSVVRCVECGVLCNNNNLWTRRVSITPNCGFFNRLVI